MTGSSVKGVSRLDGKTAVITGGGSGIGRAIATKFSCQGASIHVLDLNLKDAEETCDLIRGAGGTAHPRACDVGDQAQVVTQFQQIAERGHIDILVNNAGISHIGTVEGTSEDDFDRVLRVNVKGYYNCAKACVGIMKSGGGGVILNMASIAGSAGLADRFAYATSKGAVIAMTYSLARDYIGSNIRCNCISPARVHTAFVDGFLHKTYPGHEAEMFERLAKAQPLGRMGTPEEVASLALFLCSDEAAFVTGVDYPLDGGFMNLHG